MNETREKRPPLVRLVHTLLRSHLRGRTRLTILLARRLRRLQVVPIQTAHGATLYIDLRLGSAHGLFLNSPVETDEQDVLRQIVKPGDVAFDVGAFLGSHTTLLSQLVGTAGRVCAFEPNPVVHALLCRTVEKLPNASLHAFALYDRPGRSEFYVPGDESMASLADWTANRHGKVRKYCCECRCIDELLDAQAIPRPDVIKCDVEGGEMLVFRGARNTLNRADSPVLMFEANVSTSSGFGLAAESAMDFLRSLKRPRYEFFEVRPAGRLARVRELKSAHANIVAFPSSRADRMPRTIVGSPTDMSR